MTYKDPLMCSRSIEHRVAYSSLSLKDSQNSEANVLAVAREEVRRRAFVALSSAARSIARLDRPTARRTLALTVDQIREYVDSLFDGQLTDEDWRNTLSSYVASISSNLVHFDHLIGDLAVRWDDAWARIKAVESSMSREVVTQYIIHYSTLSNYCLVCDMLYVSANSQYHHHHPFYFRQ